MKVFSIIHTIYIALVSIIVLIFSLFGLFKGLPLLQTSFLIQFFLQIVLALIGIFTIIVHIRRKSLVGWFQMVWWIPQV